MALKPEIPVPGAFLQKIIMANCQTEADMNIIGSKQVLAGRGHELLRTEAKHI